jgi:hypothetical protein
MTALSYMVVVEKGFSFFVILHFQPTSAPYRGLPLFNCGGFPLADVDGLHVMIGCSNLRTIAHA